MKFGSKLLIFALIVLALAIGFLLGKISFTGNVVSEQTSNSYTWTTAICDSENKCFDVMISCENGKVVNMEPISGMVTFDSSWQDPRGNTSKGYCQ